MACYLWGSFDIDVISRQLLESRSFLLFAPCCFAPCIIVSIKQLFVVTFSTTLEPYDSDAMAREFLAQFHHQSFSIGQQLVFQFQEKKLLILIVKELEGKI